SADKIAKRGGRIELQRFDAAAALGDLVGGNEHLGLVLRRLAEVLLQLEHFGQASEEVTQVLISPRASAKVGPFGPASPGPGSGAGWGEGVGVYLQARVLVVVFLGFSGGLPLALSGATLRVWLRESGISLEIIGLFALVGTPYTIKFLWAPVVDALDVPIFGRLFGRRRGWLLFSQFLLIAAIVLLAFCNPAAVVWYF